MIVGLVGLLLFGSCVAVLATLGKPSGTAVKEAGPAASASAAPTASEPTEEPTAYTPKESDWSLQIKTRDKQYFGSAGCNVEVRVTPLYVGPGSVKTDLPDEGTIEITYKLTRTSLDQSSGLWRSTVPIRPLRATMRICRLAAPARRSRPQWPTSSTTSTAEVP